MEHLTLEVFDLPTKENPNPTDSQYAVLEPDATITITDTSEIFADGDVWSHSFTLNTQANAHIFGTAGNIHGSRIHEQINKRKARLWVDGLPLYLGYLTLSDEAEVDADGNVDVTFESGQKTFEELIEGAKANQVPMIGNVKIGVALWQKRQVSYTLQLRASAIFKDKKESEDGDVKESLNDKNKITFVSDDEKSPVQQYPRMVFPVGTFKDWSDDKDTTYTVNELNTDSPYTENENGVPTHPFCNVALCYQRQGYDKENERGELVPDYTSEPEAQRGYEYMPAKRVNSAPNFFVLYWIRALMNHLGIYIEENQMLDVEDLRRLFFVNTNCAYKVPKRKFYTGDDISWYQFLPSTGRLVPEYYNIEKNFNKEESAFKSVEDGFTASAPTIVPPEAATIIPQSIIPTIDRIAVKILEVDTDNENVQKQSYENDNRWLHDAYATSDCFPNVDISEVINAIESGFGVRLLFSNDYKRVRIVLLRNVFRNEEVQDITCEIVDEDVKVENNIRGFRMTYGNTEDTHFYYKGFADMLPHKKELWVDDSDKHDYSHWDLNAIYANIIHKVSAFDKTCYVTPNTGNAYGIKIDKDAKRYDELHPSLFGFADFMDAEDGDCTGEDETIKTVNMGFTPAIMNDLNMEEEREKGSREQRFALFVDETMRPRRPELIEGTDYNDPETVYPMDGEYGLYGDKSKAKDMKAGGIVKPGEFAVRSDMYARAIGLKTTIRSFLKYIDTSFFEGSVYAQWDITNLNIDGHINEGYRLYLQDNYEPNDDGISPIETHDWGLTLGIMRGSGSDAYVNYSDDPDDGENNQTWDIVPGSSATAHPDTCDSYGNEWDYNGSEYVTKDNAQAKLDELFPHSNAYFHVIGRGYVIDASRRDVTDGNGVKHSVLFAYKYSEEQAHPSWYREYAQWLTKKLKEKKEQGEDASIEQVYSLDLEGNGTLSNVIIEVDTTPERSSTMLDLCRLAYTSDTEPIRIDNGVGSRYGRFSLKLRAEKPNPYFNLKQSESDNNRRYLQITNENLRQRGLADQFYKEYSYWIRHTRIVKRTVRMTLAQLLAIDKTKRVCVGNVTGFIRKVQYSVSNETGLGNVVMEIMYI